MINKIKKIATLSAALCFSLFISCETDGIKENAFDTKTSNPLPISFEQLSDNSSALNELKTAAKVLDTNQKPLPNIVLDTVITWAASDGFYYEKIGEDVYGNPDKGTTIKYSIVFEDSNYTYVYNSSNSDYIALPKWDNTKLRNSFTYSFESKSWSLNRLVRYQVQNSDPNFNTYYSAITDSRIRFGWYIDSRDTYANYRHDVFLNGVKIEENHTFRARGNYYSINSLNENTTYKIKIVAKDQNNEGKLRIKYFSQKTANKIFISDFEIKALKITDNSVKFSWTIPEITNSSASIAYFQLQFSNISDGIHGSIGTTLGKTVDLDNEVTLNFLFNADGKINGIYSPETIGPNSREVGYINEFSRTILPQSISFYLIVDVVVPSNNPNEPYYTEYKRERLGPIQLLQN
ncbi:hypothetical protein [Aquimarina agarivorans]|uniref:hypothetical protein n=1 Tax=Aquimarina agarivorans TaxID=980584 RepID=UPI000248E822|nr:hypothetical protein [Aquimarina agarivorans]